MQKWLLVVLLTLLQTVAVAESDYKIYELNPPAAKPHRKKQLERMDIIKEYKFKGYIGEHEDGILAVHDLSAAHKEDHDAIRKVVDAENADRRAVFDAVVKFNKLNEQEKKNLVKSIYEVYRNTSAKETYYFEKKKWNKKYD